MRIKHHRKEGHPKHQCDDPVLIAHTAAYCAHAQRSTRFCCLLISITECVQRETIHPHKYAVTLHCLQDNSYLEGLQKRVEVDEDNLRDLVFPGVDKKQHVCDSQQRQKDQSSLHSFPAEEEITAQTSVTERLSSGYHCMLEGHAEKSFSRLSRSGIKYE